MYVKSYHILLSFILLHCADNAFFTNWKFLATLSGKSFRIIFSNSNCSLHVFVPHIGNSCNITNLLYLLWLPVIFFFWPPHSKWSSQARDRTCNPALQRHCLSRCTTAGTPVIFAITITIVLVLFSNKVFLIKICTFLKT